MSRKRDELVVWSRPEAGESMVPEWIGAIRKLVGKISHEFVVNEIVALPPSYICCTPQQLLKDIALLPRLVRNHQYDRLTV